MKNIYKLFFAFTVIFLTANGLKSQIVNQYGFSQNMGTYSPITGGTTLGSTTTDDQRFVDPAVPLGGTILTGVGLPIGFNFTYNGVVFDRFAINANGWISLGQSSQTPSVNINSSSSYTPISATSTAPANLQNRIAAHGRDLQAQVGAELRYQTIGTAPNQILVVQWTNYRNYLGSGQNFNFQIQLHETTNEVRVVYGSYTNAATSTCQVGLRGNVNTDFNNRTTTTNWSATTAGTLNTNTCTYSGSVLPTSGLTFIWTPPAPCSGIPTAGTVNAPAAACAGVNFNLSLSGNTSALGITYQWLSSPDGITFTPISGATNATYTTNITDTTFFSCVITCTNSVEDDTTNAVQININPFFNCYCTSNATSTFDEDIFNVTLNNLNNTSACMNATYTNYTSLTPANIMQGNTENFTVYVGTCGGPYNTGFKIFIDYNQDGDYTDPGEAVYTSAVTTPSTGLGTPVNGTFTVPLTATPGITGMRVVLVETGLPNNINPCGTFTWGETEDYRVNIQLAPPINPGLTLISGVTSSCGLGVETVSVTVVNAGSSTLVTGTNIDLFYNDGTNSFNETFTLPTDLLPAQSTIYTFTNQPDFSVNGTYPIEIYCVMTGDTTQTNDTTFLSVTSIPTITSFPYFNDFEADNGGWTVSGTSSNWEWGAPQQTVISSSVPCGTNAWTTGLTTNYSPSSTNYLRTPCFDFSAFTNEPAIRFDNIYYTEANFEFYWLESSIDNGVTWVKVNPTAGSQNWYNDLVANIWEGNSITWKKASNHTTALAGQPYVMFRYVLTADNIIQYEGVGVDNFYIGDGFTDMYVETVSTPNSACGLTSTEVITADFFNGGFDNIVNPTFCYTINGGTPVCETYTGTVLPNQVIIYPFTTTADLSVVGTYEIAVYSTDPNDIITCDTFYKTVNNKPIITTYPYFQDFESGTGGWESGGSNSTWAFGTPAKTDIQGAASGVNAWVTGGLGTGYYNNSEQSYVLSPCFDFTNLPNEPWVAVKIWVDAETSWDGAAIQMSKNQGANWTTIGTFNAMTLGFPYNWYNDNTINGNPGFQQNGWTNSNGGWVQTSHPIDTTGFIGETDVWFRVVFGSDPSVNAYDGFAFDDFAIGTLPALSLNDTAGCSNFTLASGYTVGNFTWYTQDTATLATDTVAITSDIFLQNPNQVDSVANYILVYTDEMGFTNFDSALITLYPTPLSNLGPDQSICYDDSVTLVADFDPVYSYLWSNGEATQTILVTTGGTYFVNVVDNVSGCTNSDTVNIYQVPAVDLPATEGFCVGTDVVLDAGPGYDTYAWSSSQVTQSITVSTAGNYFVTVTDSIGCVSVDGTTVSVFANPTVDLGSDTLICTDETLILDAGSGFAGYLWSNLSSAQTLTVPGTQGVGIYSYVVRVTDANGCFDRDTIVVTISDCLGIGEFAEGIITLYPNPTSGLFTIHSENLEGMTFIEVFTIEGKIVYSAQNEFNTGSDLMMNLSAFERGFYYIRLSNNEREITLPVIIER